MHMILPILSNNLLYFYLFIFFAILKLEVMIKGNSLLFIYMNSEFSLSLSL